MILAAAAIIIGYSAVFVAVDEKLKKSKVKVPDDTGEEKEDDEK